jgi:hypothetical protein
LSKLPFTPKRRRFAQNGVVLGILGFAQNDVVLPDTKKLSDTPPPPQKKKKKKGRNRGGWSHPLPKIWGGRTTPFLAKGWSATPYRPYEGGRSHPRPLGVVRPPRKAKKNKKMGLGFWGWPDHPQGPGGGRKPPPTTGRWCPKPPPGPRGWSGHPQRPKPIFPFFFFAFRGGRTTPKGLGWLRPPPYGRYGVAKATPWPKMGWSGHPDFLLLFFLFFFFSISLFFSKKKKILKFAKLVQNGVVLEWRI